MPTHYELKQIMSLQVDAGCVDAVVFADVVDDGPGKVDVVVAGAEIKDLAVNVCVAMQTHATSHRSLSVFTCARRC